MQVSTHAPVTTSTGCASVPHGALSGDLPFLGFLPLPFFLRHFLNFFLNFLKALPSAAMPTRMPSAIREIVGGPPTSTGGPAGMGSTTVVGSTIDLTFFLLFFLGRGGVTIPTSWQLNTSTAR